MFSAAASVLIRPKILLYGDAGVGKTVAGLSVTEADPKRVKLAVIDTEHSTDYYGGQFSFDVKHTCDLEEVEGAVDALLAKPNGYTSLMLDSITPLIEAVELQADTSLRSRAKSKGGTGKPSIFEPVFGVGTSFGYGPKDRISSMFHGLLGKLRRLDMAVIVTAWPKQEWIDRGSGGFSLQRGDVVPDGIRGITHLFDLILHMRKIGTEIVADVKKARAVPGLRDHIDISPFTMGHLVKIYGKESWTRPAVAKPVASQEQVDRINALITELGIEPRLVAKSMRNRGVDAVWELTPEQATEMVKNLEERLAPPQTQQKIQVTAPLETAPTQTQSSVAEAQTAK